jgi:hypothetical protein
VEGAGHRLIDGAFLVAEVDAGVGDAAVGTDGVALLLPEVVRTLGLNGGTQARDRVGVLGLGFDPGENGDRDTGKKTDDQDDHHNKPDRRRVLARRFNSSRYIFLQRRVSGLRRTILFTGSSAVDERTTSDKRRSLLLAEEIGETSLWRLQASLRRSVPRASTIRARLSYTCSMEIPPVSLSYPAPGIVLCCVCMEYFETAALYVDEAGDRWDVCDACGREQAFHASVVAALEACGLSREDALTRFRAAYFANEDLQALLDGTS